MYKDAKFFSDQFQTNLVQNRPKFLVCKKSSIYAGLRAFSKNFQTKKNCVLVCNKSSIYAPSRAFLKVLVQKFRENNIIYKKIFSLLKFFLAGKKKFIYITLFTNFCANLVKSVYQNASVRHSLQTKIKKIFVLKNFRNAHKARQYAIFYRPKLKAVFVLNVLKIIFFSDIQAKKFLFYAR